jgi:hypothetical protein
MLFTHIIIIIIIIISPSRFGQEIQYQASHAPFPHWGLWLGTDQTLV